MDHLSSYHIVTASCHFGIFFLSFKVFLTLAFIIQLLCGKSELQESGLGIYAV